MTYSIFSTVDGIHFIYDTASGAVIRADELESYLCEALDPCENANIHLPEKCPADIRYELARYSSTEVSIAYEKIKRYYKEGLIFGNSNSNKNLMRLSGEYLANPDMIPLLLSESGLKAEEIEYLK